MSDPAFNDRRSFLKSMGVGAGVVGAASAVGTPVLLSATQASAAGAPSVERAFTSGKFLLELDGAMCGVLNKSSGGWPVAEVVEEGGDDYFAHKHIGGVKYEDISIQFGPGLKASLYDQLSAMLDGSQKSVEGALVLTNSNFMVHSRLEFSEALITEISFPALDGASKEAAKMTVKFGPARTNFEHVEGKITAKVAPSKQQKKWLTSNFKLEIDGLDCSKVNKIEAITIKQQVAEVDTVTPLREPGKIDFPNVVFTMADSGSPPFFKWFASSMGEGGDERNGAIKWYAPDLKTVLGTLTLSKLGAVRVAHDGDEVIRVKVEMYCEQMSLKFDNSVA